MPTIVPVVRELGPITRKTSRLGKIHCGPFLPFLIPSLKMTISILYLGPLRNRIAGQQTHQHSSVKERRRSGSIFFFFLINGDRSWDQLQGNVYPGPITASFTMCCEIMGIRKQSKAFLRSILFSQD